MFSFDKNINKLKYGLDYLLYSNDVKVSDNNRILLNSLQSRITKSLRISSSEIKNLDDICNIPTINLGLNAIWAGVKTYCDLNYNISKIGFINIFMIINRALCGNIESNTVRDTYNSLWDTTVYETGAYDETLFKKTLLHILGKYLMYQNEHDFITITIPN